jgi:Resolvase, N terminal domain
MARRFGYSRVSTSDQDWSLQLEALTKAGVDDRDIFREKASGANRQRTELRRMLDCSGRGIRPPSTAWIASPGPSFTSCRSWRRSRARARSSCP